MKRPLKIKVCGMKDPGNIAMLAALQPDFMGLIFYPKSPRYAGDTDPDDIPLAEGVKRVGVFVQSTIEDIQEQIDKYKLDLLQLHGGEDLQFVTQAKALGLPVIKVFSVDEDFNFQETVPFEPVADFFLFDTKGRHYGGHGVSFDWSVLKKYQGGKPFFLSGGLSPENIDKVNEIEHPQLYAVDVNSGFETKPGEKDTELLSKTLFNK